MKKNKMFLMGLGSVAAVVAPVVAIISCESSTPSAYEPYMTSNFEDHKDFTFEVVQLPMKIGVEKDGTISKFDSKTIVVTVKNLSIKQIDVATELMKYKDKLISQNIFKSTSVPMMAIAGNAKEDFISFSSSYETKWNDETYVKEHMNEVENEMKLLSTHHQIYIQHSGNYDIKATDTTADVAGMLGTISHSNNNDDFKFF